MYIPQKQLENIQDYLFPGKVLVIYGARRVGKTTLINKFVEKYRTLVNADDKNKYPRSSEFARVPFKSKLF